MTYEREIQLDKAYRMMTVEADKLEKKFGERTNTETVKEGRTNFTYKCWFCDDNDKIRTRLITVKL